MTKLVQTKCFPTLETVCTNDKAKINTKFTINQALLSDTAFHRETLDRLGFLKPKQLYKDTPFISSQLKPDEQAYQKILGVEYLSLLRTGLDLRAEYSSSDDLRKYREGYLLHILDYVLQDRERVHFNDQRRYLELNKEKITLDNVFELAKEQNRDSNANRSDEEEEEEKSDIDTPDEEEELEEIEDDPGKKKKRKPTKPV